MAIFILLQHFEKQELSGQLVDLVENIARILGYISAVQQFATLVHLKTALTDIQPLVADTANFIIQYTSRSGTGMLDLHVLSDLVTKIISQRMPCVLFIRRLIKSRSII